MKKCYFSSDPNILSVAYLFNFTLTLITLIILFITEIGTYHYPQTFSLFRIAYRSEHQAT